MKFIITAKETKSGKLFEGQVELISKTDLARPENRELFSIIAPYWINKQIRAEGSLFTVTAEDLRTDDLVNIEQDNDYREEEPVAPQEPTPESQPEAASEPSAPAREERSSAYDDLWGTPPGEIKRS